MEQEKKPSSAVRTLVKLFKSRIARGIIIIAALLLSVLGMFMLDVGNTVRDEYLPFLNSNVVADFMDFFRIPRFNILRGGWMLFFVLLAIGILMTIGNMVSPKITKKFKNQKRANIVYYCAIVGIVAVITLIGALLGAFNSVATSVNVVLNVIFAVLICLVFIILIPVIAIILFYLIKALVHVLAHLFHAIGSLTKNIEQEEENYRLTSEGGATADAGATAQSSATAGEQPQAKPSTPETIFHALVEIDKSEPVVVESSTEITLDKLCLQFQSYACNVHKIYYDLPLIRSFVAGLATSRLIILEGLSGTGKTMLPRMFSGFIGTNAFFSPVQATWRDKSDVLGFYSEFSKVFKSTQFLETLYGASYSQRPNLMVLDEMNLSRIEYYFADFLSIMEYPSEDWKIRVYEPQVGQVLPEKLTNGFVTVPTNTYFIGTANTDDSTFTITDKVYDRSIVIDFDEKVKPIETDYCSDAINLSAEGLQKLFTDAQNNASNRLTERDIEKFLQICDFMKEAFDVRFGNRIMVQIENFVPVYVALGGTKEEALDFMFARKILRKVEGMYEDFVKDELVNLTKLLSSIYGQGKFAETEKLIAKFTKKLV